jgi:hypothetical protein
MVITMADSTMSQGLSIAGLHDRLNGLKGIQENADLRLTKEVADEYQKCLADYNDTLKRVLDHILFYKLNPHDGGALESAKATIGNLNIDVDEFHSVLKKYVGYLDELEKAVKDSCDQLIKNG